MLDRRFLTLLLAFVAFAAFSVATQWRGEQPAQATPAIEGRVVIAAPVLLLLFGGDQFLAANLETIRLAATGADDGAADVGYLMRAQQVVAELNACHEDNYYLASGFLTWGGAELEGAAVLKKAMNCRFWDELPAFLYGFNQAFFKKNVAEADYALELAAQRSTVNSAAYRKLAIMLNAESFADEKLALIYVIKQRDAARNDPKLHLMLDRRVLRLQGLVDLREAQRQYESKYGTLVSLDQLVVQGVLSVLPVDPLRLGYELNDGRIILKRLKIAGMENLQ